MKNQEQKNSLILNGLIIATTLVVVLGLFGFTGGFLYGTVIFKWIAGCCLVFGSALYLAIIYYIPKIGSATINKTIKKICITVICISLLVFFCFVAALVTLCFFNLFYK